MGQYRAIKQLLILLAVLLGAARAEGAYAIVGTIGAASQGAAGASVTPAWGSGQSRTAGNLLVCWLVSSSSGSSFPGGGSGWSVATGTQVGGSGSSIQILYRIATGSDAAPTFTIVAGGVLSAQLCEFSGNAATSPIDKMGNNATTSSPITATLSAADSDSGELLIIASVDFRSAARTPTDTLTSNRGTVTQAGNNNGASSVNHYSFGYILSTNSNSGADTVTMTCSATQSITQLIVAGATFKLPPVPPAPLSSYINFFDFFQP